jgi:signal transduction histidine kinase
MLREDLAIMDAEASRLERLIDDLFDLARSEVDRLPLAVAPTDLEELLTRSVVGLRPFAVRERRIELVLDILPGLPLARIDPGRLDQVVRNLLVNAIRHSPPGGLVRVSARRGTENEILVQVDDTGPGIEADDLARIWQRFYRSGTPEARDDRGAGLGLALVKELTEAMGGRVSVTSEVGTGSSFVVHLPTV